MAEIQFDNSFARLPEGFFAKVTPDASPDPALLALNRGLAAELGLDAEWLASPEGVEVLSGRRVPETAEPLSMVYAGHQFGHWNPRLGDGRALLLGEVVDTNGRRRDIQLKGSGRTPFSRQGDGKAPLGPVLREYIVSEAMAAFGVPTTRALAAVATGETVYREGPLPGAILTRVAESHVRVGSFQYFRSLGETRPLGQLADYVIDRHYPEARKQERPYQALLAAVAERQARLIAAWMRLGFIHGVMNTDNMQIAGETIDFGPCAFMEAFDAQTVLSSIDHQGRYAWCNQAEIGHWNLTRFAEALLPLLDDDDDAAVEQAKEAIGPYGAIFDESLAAGFREKLGLTAIEPGAADAARSFLDDTFSTLARERVDFTLFFRELTRVASGEEPGRFLALFQDEDAAAAWLEKWTAESGGGLPPGALVTRMRAVNPIFIPRNHRVEEAIASATEGDLQPFERLVDVLARPFDEQPEHAELERPAAPEETVHRTFCGT